tara:strand:+ start:1275 stop:1580 length:306 start_codon:yes stop_codon:yes gene_type:complete
MKYVFLLTKGPFSAECKSVVELASSAAQQEIETELFVMMDGAYALKDKRIKNLSEKGVKVTYCYHNSEERHTGPPDKSSYTQGGIPEFSGILSESDRLFSF